MNRKNPEISPLPSSGDNGVAPATNSTAGMEKSYDRYFSSGLYRSRYPRPNRRTLRALEQLLPMGGRLLDYGAGEGRYSLALAASRAAQVDAVDISAAARVGLQQRVQADGFGAQVTIRPPGALADNAFDVVLLAFGVLAHIAGREQRLALLRELRGALAPHGRLVLGLPNARRRFRAEQALAARNPNPQGAEVGDIYYQRRSEAGAVALFYHLFSRDEIHRDLAEAGYVVERLTAESVLPETIVTKFSALAYLDDLAAKVMPVDRAYGYLVVARAEA